VASKKLVDAIANRTPPIDIDPDAEAHWERALAAAQKRAQRRADVMAAYAAGRVTGDEAAEALGFARDYVWHLMWQKRKFGRMWETRLPAPPPRPSPIDVMLERFAQPGAKEAYRLRARTVEPAIGQLKQARGMRRFLHRGREACACEFRMMATGHNLRKLWARIKAISPILVAPFSLAKARPGFCETGSISGQRRKSPPVCGGGPRAIVCERIHKL
jgi:hypothetical protein